MNDLKRPNPAHRINHVRRVAGVGFSNAVTTRLRKSGRCVSIDHGWLLQSAASRERIATALSAMGEGEGEGRDPLSVLDENQGLNAFTI